MLPRLLRVRAFSTKPSSSLLDKLGEPPPSTPPARSTPWAKMRKLGPAFVVYYTAVWAGTGLTTYAAVKAMGPEHALGLIERLGGMEYLDIAAKNLGLDEESTMSMGVAFVVNELIEPIRLPIALAVFLPVYNRFKKKQID